MDLLLGMNSLGRNKTELMRSRLADYVAGYVPEWLTM
jgi:hypothetical protein